MFKRPTPHLLSGSILLYCVVLSFILALVLGFLLLSMDLQNQIVTKETNKRRAYHNAISGCQIVMGMKKPESRKEMAFALTSENADSISILCSPWGIYAFGSVTGTYHNATDQLSFIYGTRSDTVFRCALYLADHISPLTVSGKTRIKGDVYLPQEGIKSGFVNGIPFQGEILAEGSKRRGKQYLPYLTEEQLFREFNLLSRLEDLTKWKGNIEIEKDQINRSWHLPASETIAGNICTVSDSRLLGNIRILAGNTIHICGTSVLEGVLLYARKIIIEENTSGYFQVFATDSIIVRGSSRLLYPSSIVCGGYNENNPPYVSLEDSSLLAGALVAYSKTNNAQVAIGNNVHIIGDVYCRGKLILKGRVTGNVSTDKFLISTPSEIYENYLLNAGINYTDRHQLFASAFCFSGTGRNMICRIIRRNSPLHPENQ